MTNPPSSIPSTGPDPLAPARSHLTLALVFQIIGLALYSFSMMFVAFGGTIATLDDYSYTGYVDDLVVGLIATIVFTLVMGGLAVMTLIVLLRMIRVNRALTVGDTVQATSLASVLWIVLSYPCGGLLAGIFFTLAYNRLKEIEFQGGPHPGAPYPPTATR